MLAFSTKPFDAAPVDSLPVDIISTTDFSRMVAGSKTAQKVEPQKPLVDKIGEASKPKDPTPKVVDKPEIETAAAEPPPPEPTPKPPEQKPATSSQAQAEPKPAPEQKEPQPKVDQIAEALSKDQSKQQATPQPVAQTPMPHRKPPPPQPRFDAEKIAALLDKRDPQRQTVTGAVINTSASLGTATGNAPTLSQNEIDALRAQIQACWNPPAGAAEAKDLIVKVRIMLNQDGSLSGEPLLVNRGDSEFFQVAAESAMRAIRRCQPYRLPAAKYDVWKDVEVTFDPRDMYRG